MKIAILSCFYPFRGGMTQFNASILGELGKEHEVKAFNFTMQYPSFLFPGKTQYVSPDDEAVPVESTALLNTASPFSWVRTARKIRQWDPDILILRYWMSYFGPSLGYVARHMKKSCKVVPIVDNVIPHEPHFFDKPFTRYFLSGADGCITMCREVCDDLLKLSPKMPHAILEHPLYTHFGNRMERSDAETALGLEHGKKNLLFFGLIREYKGLDILIRSFTELDSSYQLIIAGEPYGPFDRYQALIDKNPNKERIHLFTNYIGDKDVKTFFSAADAVVLPYRSATQSGVSAIACHFGVPMIVTDVGGLSKTIGGRGTGLVAAKANPESIREQIEALFGHDDIRRSCLESIEKEKERLSWKVFCKELVNFARTL